MSGTWCGRLLVLSPSLEGWRSLAQEDGEEPRELFFRSALGESMGVGHRAFFAPDSLGYF